MTFEEFDKFSEELIAECFNMRTTKGKEYAHSSVDRFANFKRIAERKNVTPELVASIYLQKHMDGIESFINTGIIHSTEKVRGRIVDAITYLMLLAGILEEKEQGKAGLIAQYKETTVVHCTCKAANYCICNLG